MPTSENAMTGINWLSHWRIQTNNDASKIRFFLTSNRLIGK